MNVMKLVNKDLSLLFKLNKFNLFILMYPLCMGIGMLGSSNDAMLLQLIMSVAAASFALIVGNITSEEKSGITIVFKSLPINKNSIVVAKYINALIIIFGIAIICSIIPFVKCMMIGNISIVITIIICSLIYGMFIYALFFPLYYKLGYMKLQLINIIVFYGLIFLPLLLTTFSKYEVIRPFVNFILNIIAKVTGNIISAAITAIALYLVSMILSIKIENNK